MEPWEEGFCRAAASIAAIIAMLAVFNFIYNLSQGEPIVSLPALVLAGIVWLTGLGCRFVLGAHEAERGHKMKQV
jgi:hypothetical protein